MFCSSRQLRHFEREDPVRLNAAETLPALAAADVCAIKIEGR
jgi:collagenase-like PrtC family protease